MKSRYLVFSLAIILAAGSFFVGGNEVRAVVGDGASSGISLLDTNGNGEIDQITFSVANPNGETWQLAGALPYGVSVTDTGADVTVSAVTITSLATANPVAIQVDLDETDVDLTVNTSNSALELIYTQVGGGAACTNCINDSTDEELNAILTGDLENSSEADSASPILVSAKITSDRDIELTFSEAISATGLAGSDLTTDSGADAMDTVAGSGSSVITWSTATAAERWNTDATGSSAGVGTDADATTQTNIPNITIAALAFTDTAASPNSIGAITNSTVTTDGAGPILISTVPTSGGTLIPNTGNVVMAFSEALVDGDGDGVYLNFNIVTGGVVGVLSNVNKTVTISHDPFVLGSVTATPRNNIQDAAGNLRSAAQWTFTALASASGGGGSSAPSSVEVVADSVTMTTPNGGETLVGGSDYVVTWNSEGNINNVVLSYSTDGGATYTIIASGEADDGSYTWSVPNTLSSQVQVKVEGRDSGGATLATDSSDANFSISLNVALPTDTVQTVPVPEGSLSRTDAEATLPASVDVDDLVKVADDGDPTTFIDTAVYYIGLDAKRHPFPGSQIYFTWYENFDSVQTIDPSVLSQITLGNPVLARPGTMMIKIQSDPRTFVVEPGDYTIRWIPDEATAVALYGSAWNTRILDVEPTFFSRYTMGADLTSVTHPAGSVLRETVGGTKYYFDGTTRRAFASDAAFAANMFQDAYVITAPSSTDWMSAQEGVAITGFEDVLFSLQR